MQFCSWKKSFLRREVPAAGCLVVDVKFASSSWSSVCHASISPVLRNSSSMMTSHCWIFTHTYIHTTHQQECSKCWDGWPWQLLLLLYPFNGLFSRTTWVGRHQKSKPFWILLEQEMMGWQWHQLDHIQIICTSFPTDNDTSTLPWQSKQYFNLFTFYFHLCSWILTLMNLRFRCRLCHWSSFWKVLISKGGSRPHLRQSSCPCGNLHTIKWAQSI